MSFVTCPCGFRADGFAAEAMAAYRAHQCQHHDAEPVEEADSGGRENWPSTVGFIALLVFIAAMCLICRGWRP